MEPFYFNAVTAPLFGVYHPAEGASGRVAGVVLCYPIGREYIRAHRAFVRLAERVSAAGLHCLRFDYFGCGDSAGDMAEATMAQWIRDIGSAIDELRSGADATEIILVGLRLGAAMAALAGAEREDVSRIILWEPVVEGVIHLEELASEHRRWLKNHFTRPISAYARDDQLEVLGFPLAGALASEIESVDLARCDSKPAAKILLLENAKVAGLESLLAHYRGLGIQVEHEVVSTLEVWRTARGDGSAPLGLVPRPSIDAIVRWIVEASP